MVDIVRDVMTPDPLSITTQSTLEEAAQAMRANHLGDVLIADQGHLQGILTDRDIVVRGVAMGRHPGTTTVGDCCSGEVQTVRDDEPTEKAAEIMRRHSLRRLAVVDRTGQLVGIVSIGDLAVAEDPTSALADISAAPPNI